MQNVTKSEGEELAKTVPSTVTILQVTNYFLINLKANLNEDIFRIQFCEKPANWHRNIVSFQLMCWK